jgi:two-component system phosphate regulon sensor histidine kinase PhoR
MFRKISNRIIVSFVALILCLVAVLLFLITAHIRDFYLSVIKREIAEKINFIEIEMRHNWRNYTRSGISERKIRMRELSRVINLRITLVDFNGAVLADSDYPDEVGAMDNHRYRVEISEALKAGIGESIRYSNTLHTDMLYLAKKSGTKIVRLAKPLKEIDESISRLMRYILTVGFIATLLAAAIVIFISRRITGPVSETMSFAHDFSDGNFSRRIQRYRNDEIGTLQKALNRLADTAQDKINGLTLEQQKLETIIESIHDGIIVIGTDKRILLANNSFKSLLEIDTEVTGKLFFEAIRNRSLNSHIEQAHSTGQPAAFNEELLNGRNCEIDIGPIKGENTLQGTLLILRDVTEKKKIEKMKTDLVSNMSHELKTPVAIFKGYLETLEQHLSDPDTARDLLQKSLASVERQTSLINDILKLNRLETSTDFTIETIELTGVLQNCMEILSQKALKKHVTIRFNTLEHFFNIQGNRFLAEEVFFNIIDNAINYNHEGGFVDIEIGQDRGRIFVSVRDTGIGILPDSIDRIFERFYRVDKSRSRATGGTGLGLSIVKHAAELLNWNINVSSDGNGTIFVVEI